MAVSCGPLIFHELQGLGSLPHMLQFWSSLSLLESVAITLASPAFSFTLLKPILNIANKSVHNLPLEVHLSHSASYTEALSIDSFRITEMLSALSNVALKQYNREADFFILFSFNYLIIKEQYCANL